MLGTSRVVAALLASVMLVSPVLAQPGQPTPTQKQQAGDLVKQAIVKSQNKDHTGAIELYLKAYAIVPLAQLLSNVGTEYQSAQKPYEALKYFCLYLEKEPTGNLAGYATSQAKVLVFQITTKQVDDANVCKTPIQGPDDKKPDDKKPDDVTNPDLTTTTTVEPTPADPGKTLKITGIALGGAGVVALGIGLYFGKKAQDRSNFITNFTDPTMEWPADIKAMEAEGQSWENRQIGGLVVGSVLVIAGGALFFVGRSKTESMTVTPAPTPGGGGIVLSGKF